MIKGNCLCGEVHYEFNGSITEVALCHCDQCKRAQGAPFASNAPVPLANFNLTQGVQSLQTYLSSPNKKRVFCRTCGSPIYSQRTDMPEVIRLRLGTVTQGDIPEISYEIFCESKADWFQQDTKRPCYAQHKP
ncbi:MAG: GFA family protein [Oleiphilus sp.]